MSDYISAVILAGGQSRRMGRDKAMLPVDPLGTPHPSPLPQGEREQETSLYALTPLLPTWEKGLGDEGLSMTSSELTIENTSTTLLQHTCAIAKACTPQIFVLSSTPYDLPVGCQWIAEDPPHQGPLKAFAGCFGQIESEWILLLACDLPYLDVQVLQRWIAELEQVPASSIAYLVPNPKGWECLCGFYRASSYQSLTQFVAAGGDSFQTWLQDQAVQAIPDPQPQMLTNWNSPADLTTTIFVYGTLLAGESNHGLLANSEFFGADRLLNADLYDLGEYPMILPGKGTVTGEVYRVTGDTLANLDILEEHPEVYFRGQIILASGRSSQVYWGRSQHTVNCAGIACGDWKLRDR